jgi:hypothetical protein
MSAKELKRKRRVWPAYLTHARAQHDCPAVLMATVFKNEFLDKLEAEAKARGEAIGEAGGQRNALASQA